MSKCIPPGTVSRRPATPEANRYLRLKAGMKTLPGWALWSLALVLLLVTTRIDRLPDFGARVEFPPGSNAQLWQSVAECQSKAAASERVTVSVPFAGSEYLQGVRAALNREKERARIHLEKAYRQTGNVFAIALLSDLALDSSLPLAAQSQQLADWDESMKFAAARYYLAAAGNCFVNGRYEFAQRYRDFGLALLPPGQEAALGIEINRRLGQIYYQEKRWDEALPWLWRAAPGGETPLLIIASILDSQGRYAEALPVYWRALQDYPDRLELYLGGARAAMATGDFLQARRFLEGMQPLDNLGVPGLLLLAQACREMDDTVCAQTQYRRVLQLDATSQEAWQGLQELRK